MYLLAILLPPVAVFFAAGFMSGCLNLILTCCGWLPGVIHALMVVSDYKANQRNEKLIRALK